jgi:hypothetical protein
MKNKLLFLLPFFCLLLSSCFEITETYTIREDGSYNLNYDVNMPSLLEMISMVTPDSAKQVASYKIGKDTTINVESSLPDSIRKISTAEQLSMMKHTEMRLQLKPAENIFSLSFRNSGKSAAELKYFLSNFGSSIEKTNVGSLFTTTAGIKPAPNESKMEMPFGKNEYNYVIDGTTFQRTVKPDIIAAYQAADKELYDMIKSMDMKLTSTIVVNLPRPAKSVNHPKAVLSANRMQFTLTSDMLEAANNPSVLNFKITY